MKISLLIFPFLFVVNCCLSQIKLDTALTQHENYLLKSNAFLQYGFVIPQNIDESVLILMHADTCKLNIFVERTEEEAEKYGFEEYNNRLRNSWDLDNGSVLAQFFYGHKVYNTEIMKSIVLVSLHRYLTLGDTNFDGIITKYRKQYKEENSESKKRLVKQSKLRHKHHQKMKKLIKKERKKALKMESKDFFFD